MYTDTFNVAVSTNQLIKILHIFSCILQCNLGRGSLVNLFIREWHAFAVDHKECISDIMTNVDMDLPAKI